MWRGVVVPVALAATLSGCGLIFQGSRPPIDARVGATQTGTASWYGPGFHGNPTSSGEIYDQYELTAAHPTLPLGTRVAVTNLQNGRAVEVRVNDRGPFVKGRSIDLSYAAARVLDMIGPGIVPVRIEVLGNDRLHFSAGVYTIQVAAFADRDKALRLHDALAQRFNGVYLATLDGATGPYYRIRLGRFGRREEADTLAQSITLMGLEPIVVKDGRGL